VEKEDAIEDPSSRHAGEERRNGEMRGKWERRTIGAEENWPVKAN